jgi:hypothetical protein
MSCDNPLCVCEICNDKCPINIKSQEWFGELMDKTKLTESEIYLQIKHVYTDSKYDDATKTFTLIVTVDWDDEYATVITYKAISSILKKHYEKQCSEKYTGVEIQNERYNFEHDFYERYHCPDFNESIVHLRDYFKDTDYSWIFDEITP